MAAPPWLLAGEPERDTTWWMGIVGLLEPLLSRCRGLPAPYVSNFIMKANIEAHPKHAQLLKTRCLIPTDFATVLTNNRARFKFVRKGRGGQGGKGGCMKLRQGGCDQGLPSQELYISRLLCYMYSGPPDPNQVLEACHLCENGMCMAPWHLVWASHKNNIKGHHVHSQNRKKYHPYTQPGLPAQA